MNRYTENHRSMMIIVLLVILSVVGSLGAKGPNLRVKKQFELSKQESNVINHLKQELSRLQHSYQTDIAVYANKIENLKRENILQLERYHITKTESKTEIARLKTEIARLNKNRRMAPPPAPVLAPDYMLSINEL